MWSSRMASPKVLQFEEWAQVGVAINKFDGLIIRPSTASLFSLRIRTCPTLLPPGYKMFMGLETDPSSPILKNKLVHSLSLFFSIFYVFTSTPGWFLLRCSFLWLCPPRSFQRWDKDVISAISQFRPWGPHSPHRP